MDVHILREADIRRLVSTASALTAVREAFVKLARGQTTLPGVIGLDLPERQGEVHVKGAYLHGSPFFSIKEAGGFYGNARVGLPTTSGLVLVFDARTGFLRMILLDNGYLTDLRTGAAGALAADLLAPHTVETVGIVGSGSQARYQLEALLGVRQPRRVLIHGRSAPAASTCARDLAERFRLAVTAVSSARDAVIESDIVITTTPSREPIVRSEWVRPGTHITAVGSDGPDKRELESAVLARADLIVADRLDQCLRLGEIHHAVAEGAIDAGRVHGELGEIAAGLKRGRGSDREITVADLTGVGVQDAAITDFVAAAALAGSRGDSITL